jgi:acyl carrier protein
MHRLLKTVFTVSLVAVSLVSAVSGQDRGAIEQRLRDELAKILKKNAAQLPVDRPVTGLGVDELAVIEWQMAAERAFRVDIADDQLFEPKSSPIRTRKELSIASMAGIVVTAKPWPKGRTK